MHQYPQNSNYDAWTVAQAKPETRVEFIHKTYQHLALAIAAFIGLEALLLQIDPLWQASLQLLSGWTWLIVLLGFGLVSQVAHSWAMNTVTPGKAYMGLGLYIVAEAFLFLPMLALATYVIGDPSLILQAAFLTAIVVFGLTLSVLYTKVDLTFLGGMLRVGFFVALGVIVLGVLFGFSLGTWFSGAMVLFAGGAIAYETSNMVHHYRPGQHVAAALGLFASIALLFWYVLRILIQTRD